jgi:Cu/Ag efflux protein CusF
MANRKGILTVVTLAAVLLVFSAAALAEEAAQTQQITATIAKIDSAKSTLTLVGSDSKEVTYSVDAAARISVQGKDGALADLKAGQVVTAEVKGRKIVSIQA